MDMETLSLRLKTILVIIGIICFSVTVAFAQGPGFDEDVVDTPFDGGITLIAATAAAYGVKKLRSKKKGGIS